MPKHSSRELKARLVQTPLRGWMLSRRPRAVEPSGEEHRLETNRHCMGVGLVPNGQKTGFAGNLPAARLSGACLAQNEVG